jgi:hypothetical protein
MSGSYDASRTKGEPMPQQLPRRMTVMALTVMSLGVLHSPVASAQSTFATLTGTVVDQSGAVLPGVTITLTHASTGVTRTVVTTDSGEYQAPNLDAGEYILLFRIEGFADSQREVTLLARQVVRAGIQMQLAGTAELVNVRAVTPVIETERATIDNSRSGEEIR